jgi:hypothetical protein
MKKNELLKNEKIELSPHPLSFMGYQSLSLFLIIWGIIFGWLVNFSDMKGFFSSYVIIIILWSFVILLTGVIASLLSIRWRIFFFYLGGVLGGIGLMIWQNWYDNAKIFLPFYTVAISIVGFLIVEVFRRSHKYTITNKCIIFRGGVFTKEERTLKYDKISDINSKQGILGQIFGFGTIIPISESGFGLGSDNSFAAGGTQIGEKKIKLFGLVGGGKEVQTPRARSYYELHGIYPYKEILKLVKDLYQATDLTQYQQEQVAFQKEQVDIQKQMRDLLAKGTEKKPKQQVQVESQNEQVESQNEQVDIQKQMRDLLKMQTNQKDEKESATQDIIEEETDEGINEDENEIKDKN